MTARKAATTQKMKPRRINNWGYTTVNRGNGSNGFIEKNFLIFNPFETETHSDEPGHALSGC